MAADLPVPKERPLASATMTLTVNGKPRSVRAGLSLPALLQELTIDRRAIAVALNGDVVPRDCLDEAALADGDRIEIVRMVGGG